MLTDHTGTGDGGPDAGSHDDDCDYDDLHTAVVTSWGSGGGIANYSRRLRDALLEIGVRVSVVPIAAPETANPMEFDRVARTVPADTDVVHVQYEAGLFGRAGISGVWTPTFYARLAARDTPVVTTVHEVHDEYPRHAPPARTLIRARDWAAERIVLHMSDETVVHTHAAEDILSVRHNELGQLTRIRHPVDDRVAPPVPRSQARNALGVDAETVFVTLGWIEPKKRYMDVVRCLPELDDAAYLLAGEPRHEDGQDTLSETFALAEQLGVRDRIRHIGYVDDDDLPTLFGAADLAVAPYRRVTQSGAVNTALAYECPVVATALPAFEEIAAEYGCLITYDNPADLSKTISDATNQERATRLREEARRYRTTETWASFAARTRDLYERVCCPTR